MNPETRKNVPFMPFDVRYWEAGSWSALASSNVNETMVPVVAALAGEPPPTAMSMPTVRAVARATARNLRNGLADRVGCARVVIEGVTELHPLKGRKGSGGGHRKRVRGFGQSTGDGLGRFAATARATGRFDEERRRAGMSRPAPQAGP